MASSAHHHLPTMYAATAAPPPTPSTQPNPFSTSDAADAVSHLLHRLPPTLSLPTRRPQPPTTVTALPLLSLQDPSLLQTLLSLSSQRGFFQLTDHGIPSQLPSGAESEAFSLFNLIKEEKESFFPKNWPLGFDCEDEEGDGAESFCLDSSCSIESNSDKLSLASLREFTAAMEKVGLEMVELLARAVGFANPLKEDPARLCSLMWISEGSNGSKPVVSGGYYPFVVGLQYQIRQQKYSVLADSGWASVSPQVDSVMVTLGDIAHVWSNGKLKKTGGRPVACLEDGRESNSRCISLCLLVTLSSDSDISVFPLLGKDEDVQNSEEDDNDNDKQRQDSKVGNGEEEGKSSLKEERRVFKPFSFEDYAWRLFHERLLFKDPLDRYRIRSI